MNGLEVTVCPSCGWQGVPARDCCPKCGATEVRSAEVYGVGRSTRRRSSGRRLPVIWAVAYGSASSGSTEEERPSPGSMAA